MTAPTEDRSDRRRLRLLLVEDDTDDARRIEAHLAESGVPCDLVHVETFEGAGAALDEDRFDLCLLDLSLPDSRQVETDDRLWAHVADLPFVVMSGLDDLDRSDGSALERSPGVPGQGWNHTRCPVPAATGRPGTGSGPAGAPEGRGEVVRRVQGVAGGGRPVGRIIGAEGLARWLHPERGLVTPGAFIPLAEKTGLIVELGRQVARATCRQLAAWRDAGLLTPDFCLHVNLFARELDRPDAVAVLDEMFREVGFAPERVAFEVTETVAIASPHIVERIRALGSAVAVDGFGTGYATLERLATLELDTIKFDRLFVDRIGKSDRHEAVLEASLTLAEAMGLSSVAEGVETEEQSAWLPEHGCQFAQGFLFAPPVPAEELASWLRSGQHLPV